MAILPTSNTNTSSIPPIGTSLVLSLILEGDPTPSELLKGAIDSLQIFDDSAQANAFIERLQQVSPDIANRIFQLTWEHSGEPTHLGNRFGEEAFFGYWGRSIDPTIKLEILSQVLQETAPPLGITEIALGILCPKLRILDAKAQGLTINDEPIVSRRWILENYNELEPHVENGEGLTLLTMPQGRTLNQLIAIAAQAGIDVHPTWDPIVEVHGNIPIEQTYVILITNNVFQQSQNKSYAQQQELVARHRCVIPTVQESVALCVFTSKVFQKCLYGQDPWTLGRTSTRIDAYPLPVGVAVGGSAPTRLLVCSYYYGDHDEAGGAGGQRKLCDSV